MNPTSDPGDSPSLDTPMDEAVTWFARLRDAGADRAAFEAWLSASPAHEAAYAKVRRLWQSPALSAALGHFDQALPAGKTRHPACFQARRWMLAASLLLMAGWGLVATGQMDRWQADYTTAAGEQRNITLADGSTVTLNTDSVLALAFDDGQRGVRLLAGEAYFHVQPDSVRVVGTRFSVRAGEGTRVAVESGTVACSNGEGPSVPVTAGQQVTATRQGVTPPEPFDSATRLAWVKGRLIFSDQPLAEVLQELDRYHPGAIFIANPALARFRVTGN
ncbi:Protein FecR [Gammaproteobacteria bacterium]|nr:Protein FecR [Gammaproteobacteria bacterium]